MSRLFSCANPDDREAGITIAAESVKDGGLVVLPTDTLYGLGVDAFNNEAVSKLLATKRRGPDMPVPVLVGSWSTIRGLVREYSTYTRLLVEAFWPGGLSIVVPQAPSLPWNLGNTQGTVMLRMPLHPVAISLLQKTGPMAVSSANISGEPPATNIAAAQAQLGEAVDVYLDGGECPVGTPSTIVDVSTGQVRILREGAVPRERIAAALSLQPDQIG
ncbi:L-threonylcarbamoyladenylate synthase [Corynebacterium choanae]|uniref:L-threonylcarbamoyladenylate synthase n=1 Tax=Corynebacterium choanae TaxID=1862358 RepID=A0A3G6JA33_9CORY|nr:L-threonylcarbamoyladenylate synthase [Corynebacterium choanae]AZA13320.1 Threonylcarbamoyl-AMP synthase [Corynebacterium choanae]